MEHFTDPSYLRNEQYRDASNLEHRVALHERFSTNPTGWLPWVFGQFELPQNARILEVGCGPGMLWAANDAHVVASWRIMLTDFSVGMVAEAKGRTAAAGRFSYACLDVQQIPFLVESFDVVIANHMLYHVPDVDQALCEIARVLGPQGTLYAATNGESHLREMAELVKEAGGLQVSRDEEGLNRGLRNFSLQTGGEKLARHFNDLELRHYPDSLRVTDPEAIVAFVQSSSSSAFRLHPGQLPELRKVLAREMGTRGAIEISKAPGLFVAKRPKRS